MLHCAAASRIVTRMGGDHGPTLSQLRHGLRGGVFRRPRACPRAYRAGDVYTPFQIDRDNRGKV